MINEFLGSAGPDDAASAGVGFAK